MSEPLLSVVVPHLNQPEGLARCLDSLARQPERGSVEIVVADNGSRSLPREICARFGATLVEEPEPGPGPARNRGIAEAKAPLLAFIDADCYAAPGWLAAILAHLGDGATDLVLGGDVRVGRAAPGRTTVLEAYESVYAYRQREYITRKGFSGTGNLAMPRRVFEKVGPFAGIGVAEDRDWGRRAGRIGIPIRYVPEMAIYHPARQSFAELRQKWDRHTAHDFEGYSASASRRALWLAYALAVGASPAGEIVRIARSDRISGIGERAMAFAGLTRIRLYRFRRMLSLLFRRDGSALSGAWNRD